jgi:membrane fusion protein, multidrug efflux system
VPETFLAQLKSGQSVRIVVDSYAGEDFRGAVYAIEPAIDEQTRTVLVRARVGNSQVKLRPGMFARVQLTLAVRPNAVWIAEQAIVPRGQESFVYRVVDGKAELVKVQTGLRKVGAVEVTRGLAGGDLVITEGTQKIRPGSPVTVMQGAPKPAAAAAEKKG